MTDRIKGFTVILKNSIRDDDFDKIKSLFGLIHGVLSIKEYIEDGSDYITAQKVKSELIDKLYEVLR